MSARSAVSAMDAQAACLASIPSPSTSTSNGRCIPESSPSPTESYIASAAAKTPGTGPHQHRVSKLDEEPDGNKRSWRLRGAVIALLAAGCLVANTGCGDSAGGGSTSDTPASSSAKRNCLTQDKLDKRVQNIANGIEGSNSSVAAKQRAIRTLRKRLCTP